MKLVFLRAIKIIQADGVNYPPRFIFIVFYKKIFVNLPSVFRLA